MGKGDGTTGKKSKGLRAEVTDTKMGGYLLPDGQFWQMLEEAGGIYARAARLIERVYGISMSRQNVRQRALKDPERLNDIRENKIDHAEEVITDLLKSQNEAIRLRAAELLLTRHGRGIARGYIPSGAGMGGDASGSLGIKAANLETLTEEEVEQLRAIGKKMYLERGKDGA